MNDDENTQQPPVQWPYDPKFPGLTNQPANPQIAPPPLGEGETAVDPMELLESAPAEMLPANTPREIVMGRLAAAHDIAPEGLVKDAIALAHEKMRWEPQRELFQLKKIDMLENNLKLRGDELNRFRDRFVELEQHNTDLSLQVTALLEENQKLGNEVSEQAGNGPTAREVALLAELATCHTELHQIALGMLNLATATLNQFGTRD
jgi:hypothetical protein